MRRSAIAAVTAFTLFLGGCSPPQVTSSLEAVSTAATAAIAVTLGLEAAKVIPPAVADQLLQYAQAINTAAAKAAKDEADTNLTPAQRIAALAADFSGIAIPAVPQEYRAQVQALVTAISSAVEVFLGAVQATRAMAASRTTVIVQVKLSAGDKAVLKRVVANTEAGARALAARKKP